MADDGWLMTDRKERMRRFPAGFLASVIGHLSSAIVFLRETSRTDSEWFELDAADLKAFKRRKFM